MSLLGFSAAALSGSVVVPADPDILDAFSGEMTVNDTDGYRVRWSAPVGVIDPRWPFADCDGSIECTGPAGSAVAQTIASSLSTGIIGPDELPRFQRVADPDDSGKSAFVLSRYIDDDAANLRTEMSFSPTLTPVPRGTPCWIAFGLRIPAAWLQAAAGDEVMVFQIHETTDGGDDVQQAPIGMIVVGGGAAARQSLWVRSNAGAVTLQAATAEATPFVDTNPPVDQWQYWVVKLCSHWDEAYAPRLEAWRETPNTAMAKVIDHIGPNTYNNTGRDYVKSGVYYYDNTWSAGATVKTLHHKGLYLWRDAPWINETVLMDFLRGI